MPLQFALPPREPHWPILERQKDIENLMNVKKCINDYFIIITIAQYLLYINVQSCM